MCDGKGRQRECEGKGRQREREGKGRQRACRHVRVVWGSVEYSGAAVQCGRCACVGEQGVARIVLSHAATH